ncbi:hypothetical protein AYO20_05461 [Fonsecaea nubica]|uniref:Aminoglycoside phosphotransferase domain-containing protein n=1 Tax=Fonsecaea nubica TaxID=856822 RepID=A0A178D0N4_9EURO|nr:hypothetical protein AYO20_05461 [Fonsecaea nubica]OAL35207.1 hypothetical protein AYO20_05461 [Fonsecaea nubica]
MTRVHFPRIGSLLIDDRGFIRLENRPLALPIPDLENDEVPLDITRSQTYYTVDAYVDALLSCHDSRLQYPLNAVNGHGDCVSQMCAMVLMRALRHKFFQAKLNHGPFTPVHTDLHASNILVDDHWNVTCFIDLEWTAVLPLEFIQPPHWLTAKAVDEIDVDEYNKVREDFMEIFEGEERRVGRQNDNVRCSAIMNATWKLGTFWYVLALQSPTGLHSLLYDRIQSRFHEMDESKTEFYISIYPFWTENANDFIRKKVRDKAVYDKKLWEVFNPDQNCSLEQAA